MDKCNKMMACLRERAIEEGFTITEPELIQEVDRFVEYCRRLYLRTVKTIMVGADPRTTLSREKK